MIVMQPPTDIITTETIPQVKISVDASTPHVSVSRTATAVHERPVGNATVSEEVRSADNLPSVH